MTSLETHPDLKLTSFRQLPGFLITTTLNLPPGETEVTLQAHYVNPSSSGLQPAKPALPVNIQNKPPSRPPSSNSQRPRSKDFRPKSPARKASPSPNRRDNNGDRGGSPSVKSNSAQKPPSQNVSSSSSHLLAEVDALQYYSIPLPQAPGVSKVCLACSNAL